MAVALSINSQVTNVLRQLCATAQTVVVLQAVKFGLGKHVYNLTDDQRDITQKVGYRESANPEMY